MLSLRGPTGDNSPSISPQRDCIDNRKQYTIQMLIQQDRVEEFIFIDRFPTINESLNRKYTTIFFNIPTQQKHHQTSVEIKNLSQKIYLWESNPHKKLL